jgi:MFS family permease
LTPLIIFAQPALGESGLEPWLVAVVIGSVELGSSVMSYAADSLSGRFGLSRLTWAGGLALIGALLLGACSLPWGFPLFALLLIGAELASFGLDVSVQERVPASDRASATSLVSALESLAIGSAYLLTGALAEGVGLGGTFLLLCLGPCVSLAAFRRRRAIPALAPA